MKCLFWVLDRECRPDGRQCFDTLGFLDELVIDRILAVRQRTHWSLYR
jgi:hypothetical protein